MNFAYLKTKKFNLLIIIIFVLSFSYSLIYKEKPNSKPYKSKYCTSTFNDLQKFMFESEYKDIYFKLIFGCKLKLQNTDADNSTYFYKTGTGHLLSISGLHIGGLIFFISIILNIIIMVILRRIDFEHFPKMFISAPISIITASLYIYYIGAEIPRIRALLMAIMFTLCFLLPVFRNKIIVLLIAASIILCCFPESASSYSFYFSFISVTAVFLSFKNKKLYVCIMVYVFLLPLNIHLNAVINFFDMISNAIIIPLFCILFFPLICTLTVIYIATKLNTVFLLDFITNKFLFLVKIFAKLSSYFEIKTLSVNIPELFALYTIILLFYFLIKHNKKIRKKHVKQLYLSILVFVCFFSFYVFIQYYYNKNNYFIVYDLIKPYRINGSGDMILFKSSNKTILIDTGFGGFYTKKIINKLLQNKIDHLDYLIISHQDIDHSGGILDILSINQIRIDKLIFSNKTYKWAKDKIPNIKPLIGLACNKSTLILSKNESINFINPACNRSQLISDPNPNVLSFIFENNSTKIYFFSDITKSRLKKLKINIQSNAKKIITQMAHHCSKNDNPASFFNKLHPDFGFCTRSSLAKGKSIDTSKFRFPVFMTKDFGDLNFKF